MKNKLGLFLIYYSILFLLQSNCISDNFKYKESLITVLFIENKLCVTGTSDKKIIVWNLSKGKKKELKSHKGSLRTIAINLDNNYMLSGGLGAKKNPIILWSLPSFNEEGKIFFNSE